LLFIIHIVIKMPRSSLEKRYTPSVPSPLNPDTRYEISPRTMKRLRILRPAHKQTPKLSDAQCILRQKAAEAWKWEHMRRGHGEVHEEEGEGGDIGDSPLSRAALDMGRDSTLTFAAVDLEYSLGLDPICLSKDEKPSFGLLQPFTVDLSSASHELRPRTAAERPGRLPYSRTGWFLVILGLLSLSFYIFLYCDIEQRFANLLRSAWARERQRERALAGW
jgi:hypothetical protein